jgi:hypothetical protein
MLKKIITGYSYAWRQVNRVAYDKAQTTRLYASF